MCDEKENFLNAIDKLRIDSLDTAFHEHYGKKILKYRGKLDRMLGVWRIGNDLNNEEYEELMSDLTKYSIIETTKIEEIYAYKIIEIILVQQFKQLGVGTDRINKYLDSYRKKYTSKNLNVLSFYILVVLSDISVSLYFYEDRVWIKSDHEYSLMKQHKTLSGLTHIPYIKISFNDICARWIDKNLIKTKDKNYFLNDGERSVIEEMRDKSFDKKEITIKFKNQKPDSLRISGQEPDLSKLKGMSERYPHSKISTINYKGIKKSIEIENRKKIPPEEHWI